MADPFIGQITMFAGNFAPRNWAYCDGQILDISQYDALFSLLGTIYGGNGRTNFALPDMRGRVPIHSGQGPGLTNRPIGQRSGAEAVTLSVNEIPPHNHPQQASTQDTDSEDPTGKIIAKTSSNFYENTATAPEQFKTMNSAAVSTMGGNGAHTNMAPYQCIHFIIALVGVYPSRN